MTNKYIYITLLAVLGLHCEAEAQSASPSQPPRLVVSIAIDQLRTDYLEAFKPLYSTDGFRRLLDEGRVFANASYPFHPIDRASAMACLSTGVTPYYNSIVGMQWLNRATLRPTWCVDDTKFKGVKTADSASPVNLATSTLGDELKVATEGKAVVWAIAPNRDAAVLSAGHAADGALWIDDQTGRWCTSTYYMASLPAWVILSNNTNGPAKTAGQLTWKPMNDLVGNFSYFMHAGMKKSFSHDFRGGRRYQEFKASALVNASVTDMAKECVANNTMGVDRVTDLLCLTYYAGNYDHRTLTECPMEMQDTYVRLDWELGRLMNHLEKTFGRDNVLYVVTSTGYSDPENADYQKYRIPTGTLQMSRTSNLLNMYLGAVWGVGQYVEAHFGNHIFLSHDLLEKRRISLSEATKRSQEFLTMLSGVRNVYTSQQLLTLSDDNTRKVRNGFNPERCGDLLVEATPGWHVVDEDTQWDELVRASFIQFPIFFFGAGLSAETVTAPVTTDRIAPTVSRAIRIRAPNACSSEPLF
ncbi:MAG: alkaline phosphatase family protein [Prevotella sp.]|nr:alkaline phosphatase family protein [Prevotella sp.]